MDDGEKTARAALVISQAAAGMIEAIGMAAENKRCEANGVEPAYNQSAFQALINEYGLGYNSVVGQLRGEP